MIRTNTHSSPTVIDEVEVRRRARKGMQDAHQIRAEFLAETGGYVISKYRGLIEAASKAISRPEKTATQSYKFRRSA